MTERDYSDYRSGPPDGDSKAASDAIELRQKAARWDAICMLFNGGEAALVRVLELYAQQAGRRVTKPLECAVRCPTGQRCGYCS